MSVSSPPFCVCARQKSEKGGNGGAESCLSVPDQRVQSSVLNSSSWGWGGTTFVSLRSSSATARLIIIKKKKDDFLPKTQANVKSKGFR